MRKLFIIPAILLASLVACNSGSSSASATDSTKAETTMKTDTAAVAVAPLPAIPAGAKVFFKNLKDGQTVSSPLKLEFGENNLTVAPKAPKGQIAEGVGHYHILIDAGDSIATGMVIPEDSTHIHYGGGQTEGTINLNPGKHTITLEFGDAIHRSYGSALASTVTVNVK